MLGRKGEAKEKEDAEEEAQEGAEEGAEEGAAEGAGRRKPIYIRERQVASGGKNGG